MTARPSLILERTGAHRAPLQSEMLSPAVGLWFNPLQFQSNSEARMKLKSLLCCTAVFSALLAAIPALAHHSFAAEYDSTKVVKLTGNVTRVDWQNPHAYFYIDVKNPETGRVENWAFEMGAPSVIAK